MGYLESYREFAEKEKARRRARRDAIAKRKLKISAYAELLESSKKKKSRKSPKKFSMRRYIQAIGNPYQI